MSADPMNEAANDESGPREAPFPAEAALAAAASMPAGPVGRFQVVCAPGTGGGGRSATAFLVDTITGRSWSYAEAAGDHDGYWAPLRYAGGAPDAPP